MSNSRFKYISSLVGCIVLVLVVAISWEDAAATETEADSSAAPLYRLEQVIVSVERTKNPIADSTAAVSVLKSEDIRKFPLLNISDALNILPGITFFNHDGIGRDSIANVRGFHGGGEVEYILVLMDGQPLNDIETGLVNWNSVPLSNIESIEVIRGGASSLYGDAAIGGLVNILTRKDSPASTFLSTTGGRFGVFNAQAQTNGVWDGHKYMFFASEDWNDGFRDHAEQRVENIGGSFSLLHTQNHSLSISTDHNWTKFDEPGPLSETALAVSRTQSSPFYKFDNTTDRRHHIALTGEFNLNAMQLSGRISGKLREADNIRTLPLTPEFVDTKERLLSTSRLAFSLQASSDALPLLFENKFVAGLDAALHSLSNEYYTFFTGVLEQYQATSAASRGELAEKGEGERRSVGVFLQYELRPISPLRLVFGGRFDSLRDEYTPQTPSQGQTQSTTHSEFSPKTGLNYRYLNTDRHTGNVYTNVSRSFKAPTLDQLYDPRTIPVNFPPFKISFSSGELKPQFGTNYEVGVYHRTEILPEILMAEASLVAYSMDMEDELDFDLQQFKYVNIGESRHRGIETGLKIYMSPGVSIFANYTYQSATSQFGTNAGNYLKAIPRNIITSGISASHSSGLSGSLLVKSVHDIFLDDENTHTLPDYTTVDAKIAYRFSLFSAAVEGHNLFNRTYSTTGYPLQSDSGPVLYFYPNAERSVRVSLNLQPF